MGRVDMFFPQGEGPTVEALHGIPVQDGYGLTGDGWVAEIHSHHYITISTSPDGDRLPVALEELITPGRLPNWVVSFGYTDENTGWDLWHVEREAGPKVTVW